MKIDHSNAAAVAALILSVTPVRAQELPDIGFESVGRARPLAADIYDTEVMPHGAFEHSNRMQSIEI